MRFIDIRLCWYKPDITAKDELYTSHSIICQSLQTILKQVKDFIDNHPKEIIILEVFHDYAVFNIPEVSGGGFVRMFDEEDKNQIPDTRKYLHNYFGYETFITSEVTKDTKVIELIAKG